MSETEIRKYAGLMEELGLTGLEITTDNKMVRLERTPVSQPAQIVHATSIPAVPTLSHREIDSKTDGCSIVRSPMVGVFYAAPAENADPFVSIGTHVTKGQTLCIIEAMKLMNEIHAETDGEIVEVCAVNGQMVEYGTELFKIRS